MTNGHGRRLDPPVRWDSTIISSTKNVLCLALESLVPATSPDEKNIPGGAMLHENQYSCAGYSRVRFCYRGESATSGYVVELEVIRV